MRPLKLLVVDQRLVHVQHQSVLLLALQHRQERRLRPLHSLVNRVRQYGIQRDQHRRDFPDLVLQLNIFIGQYLKHKGFQRVEPTISQDALDNICKSLVVLGQQTNPVLVVLDPPPVFIEPGSVVDVELRGD